MLTTEEIMDALRLAAAPQTSGIGQVYMSPTTYSQVTKAQSKTLLFKVFGRSNKGHRIVWNDAFQETNPEIVNWFAELGYKPRRKVAEQHARRVWYVNVPKQIATMAKLRWGGQL